jgi:hypothetical protein
MKNNLNANCMYSQHWIYILGLTSKQNGNGFFVNTLGKAFFSSKNIKPWIHQMPMIP